MNVQTKAATEALQRLAAEAKAVVDNPDVSTRGKRRQLDAIEEKMDRQRDVIELHRKTAMLAAGATSIDDHSADHLFSTTRKGILGQAPRLDLDDDAARAMFDAVLSHKSFKVTAKATASAIGAGDAIPAYGGFLQLPHEPQRVLDLIPVSTVDAPLVEYLRHASTTGTAGMVAAGAQKPSVTLNVSKEVATVRKVAVTATANDEDLQDFADFRDYIASELQRIVIDEENSQVLSGDGTGENLTGLLTQTGIQTLDASTAGPSGAALEGVDAIEEAITMLRTGAAFCEATAVVLHPSTWSLLRRAKDSYGRYLVNPDPTANDAHSLWGVAVTVTTGMPTGEALVLNGLKGGAGLVRRGLTIESDYGQQGFEFNQTTFRCEERLAVYSPYPAALVHVTGIAS